MIGTTLRDSNKCPLGGDLMKKEKTEIIEFLNGYKLALDREKRLGDKLVELRLRKASAGAIMYSDMPKGTDLHDLSDYIIQIEDLISDITEEMRETDKIQRKITDAISSLSDELEYSVLYYRYIKLLPAAKIAEKIFVSRRTVYNIHDRAIAKLAAS